MNKNRIDGAGRVVVGGLKETAGKLTGNRTLEAKGWIEKLAGKVQGAAGRAADSVRGGRFR